MSSPADKTLHEKICRLRLERKSLKAENRRPRKKQLKQVEREQVLAKTDGQCHICGGVITGKWQADHVKPHSSGGEHVTENYLPAHNTCNNYRWDYLPEDFQIILKLGVWARTQIEKSTPVGKDIEAKFAKHEEHRISRRKSKSDNA